MLEMLHSEFNDIISHIDLLRNTDNGQTTVFAARAYFKNTTKLAIRDVKVRLDDHSFKRKYAYQWMDTENQLIIRWDNAEHHPHLQGAPFHKHVETDENVQPAPTITLREVLLIIREIIHQN